MQKLDVAILGATGAVGQRFIQLLEGHPWFRVCEVVGSHRSAGKAYAEAAHWILNDNPPASVAGLTVKALDAPLESPLVFSALPKAAAITRELAPGRSRACRLHECIGQSHAGRCAASAARGQC